MEMSRLSRDGTAELVSRDEILMRERGQGHIHFPCSADREQGDPYSCYMCDHRDRTKETPKLADLRRLMTDLNLRFQVANAMVDALPPIPEHLHQ